MLSTGPWLSRSALLALISAGALIVWCRKRRSRVCGWRSGHGLMDEMEEVLQFWFGSMDIDELQRQVWFSRGADRGRVDMEVRRRFGELVNRLASLEESCLEAMCLCPRVAIGLIVTLDQLSRHAWRGESDFERRTAAASAKAARLFLSQFGRWNPHHELVASRHAFGLLACRHVEADEAALGRMLEAIQERMASDAAQARVLERFRRATERRLRECRPQEDIEGFGAVLEKSGSEPEPAAVRRVIVHEDSTSSVGATMRCWAIAECEARGFEAKFEVGNVSKAIEAFTIAIVSLSGGVDSMVMARVLSDLRDACWLRSRESKDKEAGVRTTFGVLCMHMDYGNRRESGFEAEFLSQWCESRRLRFQLVEMPPSLRRDTTEREQYEILSREARFAAYRTLQAQHQTGGSDALRPAVLLGHHRGDLEENCLSNCLKGYSLLELAGMSAEDELHGTRVARPLLAVDKSAIYACAKLLGVPYFKDTTPHWSTRGRIRNEVLPLLRDVYGAGCGRNLEKLTKHSSALKSLCDHDIFGPFFDKHVRRSRLGVKVFAKAARHRNAFFWRVVLATLAHELGLGALSDKALKVFVGRLRGIPGVPKNEDWLQERADAPTKSCCEGWLELKKGWVAYLDAAATFYLFRPTATLLSYSENAAVAVELPVDGPPLCLGPWTVVATRALCEELQFAPSTFDAFFETASLEHLVHLNPSQASLYVAPKTLRRYPPFKALDALVRSTKLRNFVPIVGPPDATALYGPKVKRSDPRICAPNAQPVRVTYHFNAEWRNEDANEAPAEVLRDHFGHQR